MDDEKMILAIQQHIAIYDKREDQQFFVIHLLFFLFFLLPVWVIDVRKGEQGQRGNFIEVA